MKILVTGGAGFIGSHTIIELSNAGFESVIIDNFSNSDISVIKRLEQILGFPVKYYQEDCNNPEILEQIIINEKIEGVIHFAALKAVGESVEKPLDYYRNNVTSTLTLLDVMLKTGVTNFVFSSSCTVYGQPENIPVTELTPRQQATSPYGNTKVICEDIIRDTVASKVALKAIALRYFNPVGAHPSGLIGELPCGVPSNLVPFVTQTAVGIRKKLTIYGNDYDTPDGTCIRDFIHVVDLAKAHVAALASLKEKESTSSYDVYNIGTGKGNTVLELINLFEKVSGQQLNYVIGERRAGDIEKIFGNVDKASTLLKWKSQKTLEESIIDAWRWQLKLSSNAIV
ncbi:UDP-glucose 4-epimerase GalE [Arcicella aquatica]|uniref:UDP-glucose 4-epimerase n=1 Tax=Arcicella aquatica TaxID=217141 RepID=A0ABU5QN78_9BACT|nr:UDP-glucose 4-epimerase GalE [Arcicella aquatica]MEA5258365.1 UDP-glucose 4-epimerase GalE [Arcicella aquatica]